MFGKSGRAVTFTCIVCLFVTCTILYLDDGIQLVGETSLWIREDWTHELMDDIASYNDTGMNSTTLSQPKFAEERFKHRLNHMQKICARDEYRGIWTHADVEKYSNEWVRNDNFVVVPGRSFLVCVLPKCGSTTWHWLARDMREPLSAGHEFGWQDRQKNTEISQELKPSDGLKLLKDSQAFRAIAVRHPFAKLISGWNQKLANDITYSGFVLEAYPLMKKFTSNKDGKHVIAFEDFADYLATYGSDVDNLDYHFLPMQYLCRPCLYPYTHIVKLESLDRDELLLTKTLNVTQMPWRQKGPGYFSKDKSNPVEVVRTYFKNVKKSTIRKLMKLYFYDFALYGYTFDVDTLTAGGFI